MAKYRENTPQGKTLLQDRLKFIVKDSLLQKIFTSVANLQIQIVHVQEPNKSY